MEACTLINHQAYIQVSFFGDLKSEWDVRATSTFMEQASALSPAEFEVVLFYISLVTRGIFFLHKNIGGNPRHHNWLVDQKMAYCVHVFEAFDADKALACHIMPERVPLCAPDKLALKEFQYR